MCISENFRIAQSCGGPDEVGTRIAMCAQGLSTAPDNGITSTLVVRIQAWDGLSYCQVGWLISMVVSHCCHLTQELMWRTELAWHRCVCEEVAHRKGRHDLHLTSSALTGNWVQSLSATDQGIAREILNGAHFTNDGLKTCNETTPDVCPWCASSDSRYHRFWQCESLQFARAQLTPDVAKLLPSLPESLTCFGWALKPVTHAAWLHMLPGLPDPHVPSVQVLHLFTDGSCASQHDALLRFASWSVVSAGLQGDFESTHILATGVLPGILQSAYRAEVFAVRQALRACHPSLCVISLWTDCAAVVSLCREICRPMHGLIVICGLTLLLSLWILAPSNFV